MDIQLNSEISTDLLVVGGGLAGTFAAIAAKRTNSEISVWLVERYGFLGGMATAGYVFPFMRYYTRMPGTIKFKRLSGGLFQEMMIKMHSLGYCEKRAWNGDFYSRFDPMMMRCVLDDMLLEAGVSVLFHAMVNKVETKEINGGLKSVEKIHVQTKKGEYIFVPKLVIDGTGDADIIYHAQAPYEMGREEDGLVQPGTLNFRMGNISILGEPRRSIGKKIKREKQKGNPLTPRDDCLSFLGNNIHEQHFNQTRVAGFDFTDPMQMSQAELEGRKQAQRFIRFLREKIRGYGNSQVMSIASQLGIRETRRITGEYCLTEKDLLDCVQFEDRIALGNYSIDIHDPKGTAKTEIKHIPDGKWYSIPYRSLTPKTLGNVLVVGRPIASTHAAHSAIRVMPICSQIGHSAGTAAGLIFKGLKSNEQPVNVRTIGINLLQQALREQNSILE
jgi:hypothetical protein